jgi:hypothetical protein
MLFLDYDIASKLNFFKDSGEYREPVESYIDTTSLNTLSFSLFMKVLKRRKKLAILERYTKNI